MKQKNNIKMCCSFINFEALWLVLFLDGNKMTWLATLAWLLPQFVILFLVINIQQIGHQKGQYLNEREWLRLYSIVVIEVSIYVFATIDAKSIFPFNTTISLIIALILVLLSNVLQHYLLKNINNEGKYHAVEENIKYQKIECVKCDVEDFGNNIKEMIHVLT